jgi:hypothetical protein
MIIHDVFWEALNLAVIPSRPCLPLSRPLFAQSHQNITADSTTEERNVSCWLGQVFTTCFVHLASISSDELEASIMASSSPWGDAAHSISLDSSTPLRTIARNPCVIIIILPFVLFSTNKSINKRRHRNRSRVNPPQGKHWFSFTLIFQQILSFVGKARARERKSVEEGWRI